MLKFKGQAIAELNLELGDIVSDLSTSEKVEMLTLILGKGRGYSDEDYKENRQEIESIIRLLPRDQKVYLIKILAEGLLHN